MPRDTSPAAVTNTMSARAVFFDVDFTLIYPGPTFEGEGYASFCERHGIVIDTSRFASAVASAASVLNDEQEHVYDPALYLRYTRRIIEGMGGLGRGLDACAREIYDEWAACRHFSLYDDVTPVLKDLAARNLKVGLISNSHRSLASFEEHFELRGLIAVAVSGSEHGYMKPHPSIFEAALAAVGVEAAESLMVGDSLLHDIEGARRVGMRGVLVCRSGVRSDASAGVPTISDLSELPALI